MFRFHYDENKRDRVELTYSRVKNVSLLSTAVWKSLVGNRIDTHPQKYTARAEAFRALGKPSNGIRLAGEIGKKMPEPNEKTQDALNESRILVLGVQVLLGFQYVSALEPAFDKLLYSSQYLELLALALLMLAFGLFIAPAPNHLLAWSASDGQDLQRFVTRVVAIALMPFAAALAIDVYLASAPTAGLGSWNRNRRDYFRLRHVLLVRT